MCRRCYFWNNRHGQLKINIHSSMTRKARNGDSAAETSLDVAGRHSPLGANKILITVDVVIACRGFSALRRLGHWSSMKAIHVTHDICYCHVISQHETLCKSLSKVGKLRAVVEQDAAISEHRPSSRANR
jgi:hypothetical protein